MSKKRPAESEEEYISLEQHLKQSTLNFGQKPKKRSKSKDGVKTDKSQLKNPSEEKTTEKTQDAPKNNSTENTPSASKQPAAKPTNSPGTFTITELTGDIFDAPPNSVIIHACNCYGSWGAGIALAFKKNYPAAYANHHKFCQSARKENLIKTAQLIPPCEKDSKARKHYVGCLFTSKRFGKARDSPDEILRATGPAMEDLLGQIGKVVEKGGELGEIRMCRINSGLFGVEWERTKEVLEGIVGEWDGVPREILIYERPG